MITIAFNVSQLIIHFLSFVLTTLFYAYLIVERQSDNDDDIFFIIILFVFMFKSLFNKLALSKRDFLLN